MRLAQRCIALRDNAMLYKTLKQWLRTGVFPAALFGLLALGEAVAAFYALQDAESRQAGREVFTALQYILGGYILLVTWTSANRTAREMRAGAFQLYALTGLTREQMVWGILQAIFAQILFGMFCLSPYMFFAYLMGGVDFVQLIGALFSAALYAFPINLIVLAGALKPPRQRSEDEVVGSGCGLVLVLMVAPVMLIGVCETIDGEAFSYGLAASLIKSALAGDWLPVMGGLFLLMIYGCMCSMIFILCLDRLVTAVPALIPPDSALIIETRARKRAQFGATAQETPMAAGGAR